MRSDQKANKIEVVPERTGVIQPWSDVLTTRKPSLAGAISDAVKEAGYEVQNLDLINLQAGEKIYIDMTVVKADQDE
jgi:hypothetical protein